MHSSLRFSAESGDSLRSVELVLAGAQPRPPRPVRGRLCAVVVVVRISVCLGRPGRAAGAVGGAAGGRLLGAHGEVPHQPEPAGDSPAPRLASTHRPAGTRCRRSHGRRAGASTTPGYETPPSGRVLEVRRLGDIQHELVADVHVRGRLPEAGQRPQAAHHSGDRETIIVFMQKQIHFLCSQKKANLIGTLKDAASEAVGSDIVLHVKSKNGDGIDLMDEILHVVSAQSKSDTPVVGHIAKEAR
ncbi:hypothetical protein ZWY2020_031068 [Hordeum vulgare]|nr:hypothetical protein ZWY2020_031068 [Hordeum vulgare]